MSILIPPRRFDPALPELMERDWTDSALIRSELQTLEWLNRHTEGHALVVRCLRETLGAARPSPLRILDLGTGAADVPRAIVAWARSRQLQVEITAVDNHPAILQCAREWCGGWPEIQFEQCDLLDLPYAAGSFDIVMCSLALHHFSEDGAVSILRQIQEVARVGYIVNDLRRNWVAVALVNVLSSLFVRNPVTRHDVRASCRAAFTEDELRELANRAGLTNFQLERHHGIFRMVLRCRK